MTASHSAKVTVSSKGWVVITAPLRRKIRLNPGMKMIAEEVEGRTVLTPQSHDPVDTLFGKLDPQRTGRMAAGVQLGRIMVQG